jgi:acyl carrier protein
MLLQIMQDYLVKHAGVSPEKFGDPELMVTDLGLDSLGIIGMLYEIEERYGIQIDEPFRYNAMKFSDLVSDIEAMIRGRIDGGPSDRAPGK